MDLVFEDWGSLQYREAWARQKSLVDRLQRKEAGQCPTVVFVEHPHVYTLGFHGNEENLLADLHRLQSLGIECVRIERGGDITYHGPGQLVAYPIVSLPDWGLGVKRYVELLENSVIRLLSAYGIDATSNSEAIGVWIDWGTPKARKICAIGVKVSHGVTMHGFALNVNTDLSYFSNINPCGFKDKGVSSMERELGRTIDFSKLKADLAEVMRDAFEEAVSISSK